MTKRNTKPNTTASNATAAIDAALAQLAQAGAIEAKVGGIRAELKETEASAEALAIAALTVPGVLSLQFAYDVKDRKGEIIEHVAHAKLADYSKGFEKDGKEYRAKATGFRNHVLPRFFNVPGDAEAVWAMFRHVYPVAVSLIAENMTATVDPETHKLVVSGGEGEQAKRLRDASAKSIAAMKVAARGEGGARKPRTPGETAKPEGEAVTITFTGMLTKVRDYLREAAKPNGEPTESATSEGDRLLREIEKLLPAYWAVAAAVDAD